MPNQELESANIPKVASPWPAHLAMVLVTIYCLAFLIRVPKEWSSVLAALNGFCVRHLLDVIKWLCSPLADHPGYREIYLGLYFLLILLLFPWTIMLLLRRGDTSSLGIRRPNRIGVRILIVGYLVALPATYWVTRSPQFVDMYLPRVDKAGYLILGLWFLANVIGEHFLLHGVVLALGRRTMRWPAHTSVQSTGNSTAVRILQWFGLAQHTGKATGLQRLTIWIGLPSGCGLAIWTSAILFAAVHLGKSPRELLVSIPNGLLLAYAAYRTDTWLVPLALHVAAAITSLFMAMWF